MPHWITLHEFLGMTWAEYGAWVIDPAEAKAEAKRRSMEVRVRFVFTLEGILGREEYMLQLEALDTTAKRHAEIQAYILWEADLIDAGLPTFECCGCCIDAEAAQLDALSITGLLSNGEILFTYDYRKRGADEDW